jgi:hypothetical protein
MFLEPINIRSPFTGETVLPKITTHTTDGKTFEQVSYNDPVTGNLIKKGMVSVRDAKTGEILQDYKTQVNSSTRNIGYR